MSYDMVVRGGNVADGSGMAAYRADVGIIGNRIARIGRIRERGVREIDAEGHIVSPGFIDAHTHMDAQVNWDPLGTSSCWHGVTSVVMGNCGFTLAPSHPDKRALVLRNLERAEDIPARALAEGANWRGETFPEYLDMLERLPKGINYSSYIGHSALRTWTMGERAFESASTDEDLRRMEQQLREALRAGAIGFSTSRQVSHETSDDRPVASRLAAWEEVERLVSVMGEQGAGIFQFAPEGALGRTPEENKRFFEKIRKLAVVTGVPTTFGLFNVGARELWQDQLSVLEQTAAAGGVMFGQSHSNGPALLTSFLTKLPFDALPEWKQVRAEPLDVQRRLFADPQIRARLVHAAQHGQYGRAIGAEARKPDWNLMEVYDQPLAPHPTVADMAAQRGVDPVELMIDLALESDFKMFFLQWLSPQNLDEVLAIMRHPRVIMTFSDSGAHVSQIIGAFIQTNLLAYWARQRQVFTVEEAVRMISYAPARAWGFSDRGLLREGMIADLNVFDFDTVMPGLPEVARDLPGGERRLIQKSQGFLATIVGGKVVLDRGEHTGELPGVLIRGPLAHAAAGRA